MTKRGFLYWAHRVLLLFERKCNIKLYLHNIEKIEHKTPTQIVQNIKDNDKEINSLMSDIENILNGKNINE